MKIYRIQIILFTPLMLLLGFKQLHSQEGIDSTSMATLLSLVEEYERPEFVIHLDTINYQNTNLESRHLSYIYNFSMNSALHKYDSYRWNRKSSHSGMIISDKPTILIVEDALPAKVQDLKLFIPTDSDSFILLQKSQEKALQKGLISQFNLEHLPKFDTKLETYFSSVMDSLNKNNHADFAISFSDLYAKDEFVYLFIGISFSGDNHYSMLSGTHIFEFEWCDSMLIFYPRRVSAPSFHFLNRDGRRDAFRKIGGTIDIPSLKCY